MPHHSHHGDLGSIYVRRVRGIFYAICQSLWNHMWGPDLSPWPVPSSLDAEMNQPIVYTRCYTHAHIYLTGIQMLKHFKPLPLKVALTNKRWWISPSVWTEQVWQTDYLRCTLGFLPEWGRQQADRQTDGRTVSSLWSLMWVSRADSYESFSRLLRGPAKSFRYAFPLESVDVLAPSTSPWLMTKEVNIVGPPANAADAMANRNTKETPRVWRQIYFCQRALIGIIPIISGFKGLGNEVFMDYKGELQR